MGDEDVTEPISLSLSLFFRNKKGYYCCNKMYMGVKHCIPENLLPRTQVFLAQLRSQILNWNCAGWRWGVRDQRDPGWTAFEAPKSLWCAGQSAGHARGPRRALVLRTQRRLWPLQPGPCPAPGARSVNSGLVQNPDFWCYICFLFPGVSF